jgi:ACDE family multidrug resistance protein
MINEQLTPASQSRWSILRPLGTARSANERLAIAISVGAMGTLGFAVTSPILPELADEFDVSRGSIGLVQAAVSLPGIFFSALIGYLADRIGRRRVVLSALIFFSVFGVAGFFARSFWLLIGARFLQGIGTSGILGVGIVLIGDAFSGAARTRAMGINITGLTVVAIAGPAIAGLLAVGGTFRPFLIFLIGFPLGVWATRMPSDKPSQRVDSSSSTAPNKHFGSAVSEMRARGTLADYMGVLLSTLGAVFVLHGLGLTVTPLFLEDDFGLCVTARGFVLASFQIGVIVVAVRIGTIVARFGIRNVLTAGFWLMSIGSFVGAAAPEAWVVGVGLGIAGLGFGLITPVTQTYVASAAGDQFRGLTVLMWVTMVRTAQVLGPPTGSLLAANTGSRSVFFGAAVGMAILAIAWQSARQRFGVWINSQQ